LDKKTYETWAHLKGDPDDGFVTIDPEIRKKFHAQSEEKKAKSLAAKTFILYPFEIIENQAKPFDVKEKETMEFIINHLESFKKPYIATSFGSDSIVLMHIVMRAAKKLGQEYPAMVLNDTLNTFKEEKQYWADIIKLWGIQNKVIIMKPPKDERGNMYTVWSIAKKYGHLPSFRKVRRGGDKDNKILSKAEVGGSGGGTPECCSVLKKKTLKAHLNQLAEVDRYDCQFVGTRAQESRMRSMSVLQRCRSYIFKHFAKYPMRTVTPLSFWLDEDIAQYYKKYDIPKNPAYKAHNMSRMGCASCPAHVNWEIRLAIDPTTEGLGMLRQNLKILKETIEAGTERPDRLNESLTNLKKLLDGKIKDKKVENSELPEQNRPKIIAILKEFGYPMDENLE
jgi:3'-phosphoadenosine 5'-phosphosulfate sulfotransferase (PAPS reductase)/FAD synthetase